MNVDNFFTYIYMCVKISICTCIYIILSVFLEGHLSSLQQDSCLLVKEKKIKKEIELKVTELKFLRFPTSALKSFPFLTVDFFSVLWN